MVILSKIGDEVVAWVEAFVRSSPGRFGSAMRRLWFRKCLQRKGGAHIGPGCEFVSPHTIKFEGAVWIGKDSFFTAEGGSIVVGNKTAFNMNVHINASVGGSIRIGECCLIGPNVVMRTAGHRFEDPNLFIRVQGHLVRDIHIDDDVWIGANAVILGGARIGRGAVVGAGAVVSKNVPAMGVAVGVPAKVIALRGQEITSE